MKNNLLTTLSLLGLNFAFISNIFYNTFKSEDPLMSEEANDILKNDDDRKKIEEAIKKMKKDRTIPFEEIELSNSKKLKISIN